MAQLGAPGARCSSWVTLPASDQTPSLWWLAARAGRTGLRPRSGIRGGASQRRPMTPANARRAAYVRGSPIMSVSGSPVIDCPPRVELRGVVRGPRGSARPELGRYEPVRCGPRRVPLTAPIRSASSGGAISRSTLGSRNDGVGLPMAGRHRRQPAPRRGRLRVQLHPREVDTAIPGAIWLAKCSVRYLPVADRSAESTRADQHRRGPGTTQAQRCDTPTQLSPEILWLFSAGGADHGSRRRLEIKATRQISSCRRPECAGVVTRQRLHPSEADRGATALASAAGGVEIRRGRRPRSRSS